MMTGKQRKKRPMKKFHEPFSKVIVMNYFYVTKIHWIY